MFRKLTTEEQLRLERQRNFELLNRQIEVEKSVFPSIDKSTLETYKDTLIKYSKIALSNFLEGNPLSYNNEYYSVTQEKQALLTSAIATYQLRTAAGIPAELKWNTTGDICTIFTLEEITGLVVAISDYVQPRVEKQQEIEVEIQNAATVEELDGVVIDYEEA